LKKTKLLKITKTKDGNKTLSLLITRK